MITADADDLRLYVKLFRDAMIIEDSLVGYM